MLEDAFEVSQFVEVFNQTLEYAYPIVKIRGEVAEFRVSKGRWVYLKLKDDDASIQIFGSIYNLSSPIENGMIVLISGIPRLHNRYGFSVSFSAITPEGEGSIKRAQEMLKQKLDKEGLFDLDRKRPLPSFPIRIGLVASEGSAAHADFMMQLARRWGGIDVVLANVQVQGLPAPRQVVLAINALNSADVPVDVIVVVRGGGSAEDLQAFSDERVVRSIALSRAPTIVGVGHETDTTLADLAADARAITPTDAARLVVSDRSDLMNKLEFIDRRLNQSVDRLLTEPAQTLTNNMNRLVHHFEEPKKSLAATTAKLVLAMDGLIVVQNDKLNYICSALKIADPASVLKAGYAVVRNSNGHLLEDKRPSMGEEIMVELAKYNVVTEVKLVKEK